MHAVPQGKAHLEWEPPFQGMGEGHTWQAGNNVVASGSLEVEVECNTNESAGV